MASEADLVSLLVEVANRLDTAFALADDDRLAHRFAGTRDKVRHELARRQAGYPPTPRATDPGF